MTSKADECAIENCSRFKIQHEKKKPRKLKHTVFIELPENLQKITGSKLRLSLEMSHKRLDTTLARHCLGVVAKMKRKY